jgi:hypothetical protein
VGLSCGIEGKPFSNDVRQGIARESVAWQAGTDNRTEVGGGSARESACG